jgi:hypothetical protein
MAVRFRQLAVLKHVVANVPELDLTRFEFICAGRYIEHPAFHAALFGDLPALHFLLPAERAADRGLLFINVRHPTEGDTLLQQAVGVESVHLVVKSLKSPAAAAKVVEFLVERGADPTIRDCKGETPADFARREGLEDVARWLEEAASKGDREEAVRRGLRIWAGWGVVGGGHLCLQGPTPDRMSP